MQSATAVTRDADARPARVETEMEIDASVATARLTLAFTYDEPTAIRWTREDGDLKSLVGTWGFEAIDGDRTRATYALEIGLSRKLGLLARAMKGPVEAKVRELLTHRPVEGLEARAETPG